MAWLDDIRWLTPLALVLLPLPWIAWYLLPAGKARSGKALRVPDMAPYQGLSRTVDKGRAWRWLRVLLLSLAWICLLLAAARPQSFGEPIGVPMSGRDLMLCIDISGSMREADLYAGNTRAMRISVVKQVARDFVARRTGDRVGLIMFGSQAYVQTPLTRDHTTLEHFLDEAVVGLAGRSTAIGDAIGLAVKRLRERPEASRVIILLTDGENSAGVVEPLDAARLASRYGIRIHSIGVGSELIDNPLAYQPGTRRSELDEKTLRAISDETGGQYFRARNQKELESIYAEIDRLEPTEQESEEFRPLRELFAWPLAGSLILSMLWALTGSFIPSGTGVDRGDG